MSNYILDEEGNKFYYENELLHRSGGPAIEYVDGGKEYYYRGQRHRTDGPAIEFDDESQWYYKGNLIPDVCSVREYKIIVEKFYRKLEMKAFW